MTSYIKAQRMFYCYHRPHSFIFNVTNISSFRIVIIGTPAGLRVVLIDTPAGLQVVRSGIPTIFTVYDYKNWQVIACLEGIRYQ